MNDQILSLFGKKHIMNAHGLKNHAEPDLFINSTTKGTKFTKNNNLFENTFQAACPNVYKTNFLFSCDFVSFVLFVVNYSGEKSGAQTMKLKAAKTIFPRGFCIRVPRIIVEGSRAFDL